MDWDKFFFSNVGKKIKSIIRGIFYTEAILTIIAGVVAEVVSLYYLFDGDSEFFLIMLGIPVGVVLAIGALWLSTLLTYGFAEIVDTAIINRQGASAAPVVSQAVKKVASPIIPKQPEVPKTPKIEKERFFSDNDDDWMDICCPHCGEKLSFLKGTAMGQCPNCDNTFDIK